MNTYEYIAIGIVLVGVILMIADVLSGGSMFNTLPGELARKYLRKK